MVQNEITVFRVFQMSSQRTLGYFSGDDDTVRSYCHLKFEIEHDDIALEKVPVRNVTRSEVLCFSEIMDQLRTHRERVNLDRDHESPEVIKSNLLRMMSR